MMKRFVSALLCCCLVVSWAGMAAAEEEYTRLPSLEGFYGMWTSYGSNDSCPYLVLHADGTFETYDYWQLDERTTSGDALMKHGAYTFNPADSTLVFEGNDTVYTAKTAPAGEGYENSIGELTAVPGQPMLLLEGTDLPEDAFGDPSMLFLPMTPEDMALLPTREAVLAQNWLQSDALQVSAEAALPCWHFYEEGAFSVEPSDEADQALSGAYAYDNGLLTVTAADGQARHFLLQYAYMPLPGGEEGDPAGPFNGVLDLFDYDSEADYNASTLLSNRLLVVHDLEQGALSYWMAPLE